MTNNQLTDRNPMAWLAIYHGEVYDEAIGTTRSVVEAQADRFGWESALTEIIPLYRHPQPLTDAERAELQEHRKADKREAVRAAHAAWSDKTFGSVGPIGPLKHLSKEALEAAAKPEDLSEWADMQFLLWDAQRRAGITDEQITQAMLDKLAVNESRDWPKPKDGEPRFHVKSGAELQEHRKAAAEPVRYLNKFSGACVTLEQQPNAADDIAVYMPLYASSQPLTDAGEHFQRGYDEGHSRGLTCGKLYKGDDQMRQHRAECVKVYRAEINGGEID